MFGFFAWFRFWFGGDSVGIMPFGEVVLPEDWGNP